MSRNSQIALLLGIALSTSSVHAEIGPASAAEKFMRAYLKPNPEFVPLHRRIGQHVSTKLSSQLQLLDAAETAAAKCDPGLPLYEGDLLTSYAESAERFKILSCRAQQSDTHCVVALEAGRPPDASRWMRWRDTLLLKKEHGGWRVSDVKRSQRAGPELASSEISQLICGVASHCPITKWPNNDGDRDALQAALSNTLRRCAAPGAH